jgi:hypothetical protein
MALTDGKDKFIKGLTDDLLKSMNNPSEEVKKGMEDWCTTMYTRIAELVTEATIVQQGEGTYKIQ